MVAEHPFAPFIRLLGKGTHLSRPLTEDEAFQAGTMILQEKIEPQQLGAFLSLVRMTTETIDEMIGFTRAMREYFQVPLSFPKIDLDWPSYAGKKNRNPWFLLSALLLVWTLSRSYCNGHHRQYNGSDNIDDEPGNITG